MDSVTVTVNSVSIMPTAYRMSMVLGICLTWLATEELPPPVPPVPMGEADWPELEAMSAVENRPINNIHDRSVEVRLLMRVYVTGIIGNQAFPGMSKHFRHFPKRLFQWGSTGES